MKKVININFQGRVIPIEETAYDMLKQYVESLRIFFANEEGKDEIINDIEGRIAELFGETLKKGSICITDGDVNNIIKSMGRPEEFDDEEASVKAQLSGDEEKRKDDKRERREYTQDQTENRRLYRDENHKILGGVCSGIANYFNIDPIIVRILFIVFNGLTVLLYLILWVAVPSSSSLVIGSRRKRLFRDTENKMIAGVCAGLAQYFSVQVWVPRVLFLIPFLSFVFRWGNWGWWDFPHFLSFSFSPGAIVVYIILWLVLPEAVTTAEKLEMKGEKVDMNTIKSTIQSDMEGFKGRAQVIGSEIKEKAQEIGEDISRVGKKLGTEASAIGRRSGSGLGHVLATIIKIFVYFVVGCIVFSIVIALFALGVALTGLLPAYSYVLDDGFQRILAWGSLIFFIWVPVIAIVTWIIRRISGKKGKSGNIRLTFFSLWILGIICFINLLVSIRSDFRYKNNPTEETITITDPNTDKLEVKAASFGKYYNKSWLRFEPFEVFDEDTIYVRNIHVRLVKATGDSFEVKMVRLANGSSRSEAERNATNINYNLSQRDSILQMDKGIAINKQDKFRNQQVIVTVAVPVGKRIFVNDNIGWGNDARIEIGNNDGFWDWENNEETRSLKYRHNVEYVMTEKGLERVNKSPRSEDDYDRNIDNSNSDAIDQYRKSREQLEKEKLQKQKELDELERELQVPIDSTRYKYSPPKPATPATPKKTELRASNQIPSGMQNILMIKFPI